MSEKIVEFEQFKNKKKENKGLMRRLEQRESELVEEWSTDIKRLSPNLKKDFIEILNKGNFDYNLIKINDFEYEVTVKNVLYNDYKDIILDFLKKNNLL
jgi:hypothetical protein